MPSSEPSWSAFGARRLAPAPPPPPADPGAADRFRALPPLPPPLPPLLPPPSVERVCTLLPLLLPVGCFFGLGIFLPAGADACPDAAPSLTVTVSMLTTTSESGASLSGSDACASGAGGKPTESCKLSSGRLDKAAARSRSSPTDDDPESCSVLLCPPGKRRRSVNMETVNQARRTLLRVPSLQPSRFVIATRAEDLARVRAL
tara:strand:- start:1854 stop:2462 length:609 start_codon:yes stop_codon:yes gene_type:complete